MGSWQPPSSLYLAGHERYIQRHTPHTRKVQTPKCGTWKKIQGKVEKKNPTGIVRVPREVIGLLTLIFYLYIADSLPNLNIVQG